MVMTKKMIYEEIKRIECDFDFNNMKFLIGFTKQWVIENKRRNKAILRQLNKLEDELYETGFLETERVVKLIKYILN